MNPASITKLTILASVGCAFVFLFVFFAIGFGWLGAALIGAAAGHSITQRAATQTRSDFHDNFCAGQSVDPAEIRRTSFPTLVMPPRSAGSWAQISFIFDRVFLSLPRYQRLASLVFLLQAAVSLVTILVFCIVQTAGFDIRTMEMPSFAALFANAYPIGPDDAFAKTRFDNLFLPLVSMYVVSLSCLAAAVARSLRTLLTDVRKHWRLLVSIVFFPFGLWLILFVREQTARTDLQLLIIHGSAYGYVLLFVLMPILFAFLAAGLPEQARCRKSL